MATLTLPYPTETLRDRSEKTGNPSHLAFLKQRASGIFSESDAIDIEQTEKVASFLPKVFGNDREYYRRLFHHWWDLNPSWDRKSPKGWAVYEHGQVVAFTANIPLPYIHEGRSALCYATGCTAVDERFRGLGLSKLVGAQFVNQQDADLLLAIRSTPVAYHLWQSLGMKVLSPWHSSRRIVGDPSILLAKLGLRSLAGVGTLAANGLTAIHRTKVACEQISTFEAGDDRALEKCRASNETTFARRDVRTLNWLFAATELMRETRIVLAARSSRQLLGYAALKPSGCGLELLECRCRDSDPEIARALLVKASELARERRYGFVRVRLGSNMMSEAMPRGLAFPDRTAHPTYCALSPAGWSKWEATAGDGDFAIN
jgi:hypothetical protein